MFKLMMMMMTLMATIMSNCSHPFILSFLLMIQTIIITLLTRILCTSSWMSLTLFLVMVGGLMIIFMYTSSICSNQRFVKNKIYQSMIYFILWMPIMISQDNFFLKTDCLQTNNFNFKEFFKLFMPMNMISSMFMFMYLILMLMVMINLLSFNMGPMRKKY